MIRVRCLQRLDLAQHHRERVVDVQHEHAPHDVDDADRTAVAGAREIAAVAGRAGGIVRRPQQPRLGADVVERFLLVPDMVARRHHVDAPLEQLIANLARDAEAGGRVLGVRDDEIDPVEVDDARQPVPDELAPGLADDVADEQGCARRLHG